MTPEDIPVRADGVLVSNLELITASTNAVEFEIHLREDKKIVDVPIKFDTGLDKLGLTVDGSVQLAVGFDLAFGFGVSRSDGVYFNTSFGATTKTGQAVQLV